MTPIQYHESVLAELDAMRSPEKNRILLGLIAQLYPTGDPDHRVDGASFTAEAINLLSAFHPNNLKLSEEANKRAPEPTEVEF